MSQELSSLRSQLLRPSSSSRIARSLPRKRTAPPRLALHPAAKVRQTQLPLHPRRTPRKHRPVLSRTGRPRNISPTPEQLDALRKMTDDYRRLRQARSKLVRWQRQLLQLVDALQAARVQQGEASFRNRRASPSRKPVPQEVTHGPRRLRKQQAVRHRRIPRGPLRLRGVGLRRGRDQILSVPLRPAGGGQAGPALPVAAAAASRADVDVPLQPTLAAAARHAQLSLLSAGSSARRLDRRVGPEVARRQVDPQVGADVLRPVGMVQKRPFSGNTRDLSADPDRSRVGAGLRESLVAVLGLQFRENRVYPRSSSQ